MSESIDPGSPAIPVVLRLALALAATGGVVGMLGDSSVHHVAAGVALAVLIATPLLRVLLLAGHWARLGDRRSAITALGVAAVAGVGAVLAMI